MRATVNHSKRKLTATSLVVNWRGYGTLFFRMSKNRVKAALANGTAIMNQRDEHGNSCTIDYPVRRFPSGSIAIA